MNALSSVWNGVSPSRRWALARALVASVVTWLVAWWVFGINAPRAVAVGLFTGAVVLSALFAAIERAAKPVGELVRTARAMVGDLSVRSNFHTGEAIDDLAHALDDLADDLAESIGSLKREHDRLGAILEAMVEGVLVTDASGKILLANSALREMFLVGHDVVGKRPVDAIRDAELQVAFHDVAHTRRAVTRELNVEGGLRPRRVLARVAPVSDAREGAVALLSDVTELRRLETMRRDFVANVSHELRTPVAAIAAACETLECGAVEQAEHAREFLQIIDRNTVRLRQLVEDLLQLSRIEAKKLNIVLEPVDVSTVVSHCIELFAMASERKNITLVHSVPQGLPSPRVDRRALEQILSNLIDNAIKYCPERASVTVLAKATPNGGVRVSVKDTGPGIEARHLPRLFERFYRVDTGRSRQEGGTGLGLAIVKHLAEAMQAEVDVESQPGAGTVFHLDLRPSVELPSVAVDSAE